VSQVCTWCLHRLGPGIVDDSAWALFVCCGSLQGVNEVCSRVMKKSTALEVATPNGTIIVNLRSGFPAPYKCGVNVALQTQHKVCLFG
jgi:hypothetical protein